jgi:hypothetical protein
MRIFGWKAKMLWLAGPLNIESTGGDGKNLDGEI